MAVGGILLPKISHDPLMRDRRALSLVGSVRAAVLSMSIVAGHSRSVPSFRPNNATHTLVVRRCTLRCRMPTGHAEEQNLSETRRELHHGVLTSGVSHTLPDRLF